MDEINHRYLEMQEIEDEFINIFKSYNIPIGGISQQGISIVGQSVSTRIRGPKRNRELINTDYFYSTGRKLLHFTSLKSLFSIINEKSLRLYNLNNSDDPDEYVYPIGKIRSFFLRQGRTEGWIQSYIQNVKESSFILSCTSPEEITNSKFWVEYADNGKGVSIEIEIENDPISWEGFYASRIKYGQMELWDEFISDILSLCDKHPTNSYDFIFDMIFCLHKKPESKYIEENEIRILAQSPEQYGTFFEALIKSDISLKNRRLVNFIKLPLVVEKGYEIGMTDEDNIIKNIWNISFKKETPDPMWKLYFEQSPSLKITKIYVCQDFEMIPEHETLIREIEYYCHKTLGYWIPISQIQYIH